MLALAPAPTRPFVEQSGMLQQQARQPRQLPVDTASLDPERHTRAGQIGRRSRDDAQHTAGPTISALPNQPVEARFVIFCEQVRLVPAIQRAALAGRKIVLDPGPAQPEQPLTPLTQSKQGIGVAYPAIAAQRLPGIEPGHNLFRRPTGRHHLFGALLQGYALRPIRIVAQEGIDGREIRFRLRRFEVEPFENLGQHRVCGPARGVTCARPLAPRPERESLSIALRIAGAERLRGHLLEAVRQR